MSNTKTVMSQAANTLVKPPVNVEDVFSTYLYDGTGAAQTITNGIDLDGEGGLVWVKARNANSYHSLWDTERGTNRAIFSHLTNAESNYGSNTLTAFNSNGFSLGSSGIINDSAENYASWTFRKAPKFFTCLTYTGTGSVRTVSHNLGSVPGCIIVKAVSGAGLGGVSDWTVYHRGVDATNPEQYRLYLNTTGARVDQTNPWNDTAPTSTEFTVGTDSYLNANGDTYVAYLFAHNDGDGGFGADGDADIIKCGSYTGNGSTDGPEIDLGFEPQWVMIKGADISRGWVMADVMRGAPVGSNGQRLFANTSDAETAEDTVFEPTPTGFKIRGNSGTVNDNGLEYIYMAIRRGTKVPESATEVFEVFETTNTGTASTIGSMGPSDFILNKRTDAAATWRTIDRLRSGSMLRTDSTDTETSASNFLEWDKMGGVFVTTQGAPYITNDSQAHWMWKRAPNYFDVVAYTGVGTAGRTVSHNLGVAPEMMWVKGRNYVENWGVYHKDVGATKYLMLNQTSAESTYTGAWNDTAPTSSVFTLGGWNAVNESGYNYIAYLFASLPGISKVGSYTGNGTSQNIDCGFTSGARFVLIKRASGGTGNWMLYDTERGITSSSDPVLKLNNTDPEENYNHVQPNSSGFSVTYQNDDVNNSGDTYIFYAIA